MFEEFEKLLDSFFLRLKDEIKQSLHYSHGISFDAGCLAERINFVLNNTRGTASNGGGAFDATNGSEVKCAFFAQPSKCNSCGNKVHYYSDVCTCGSTDLQTKSDTRWGIDAAAHIKYLQDIPYYLFVAIHPLNKDLDNLRFKVNVYRIEAYNHVFNQILLHQVAHGSKPHKNFMPYGRDFYLCSPTQILSVELTIGDSITYDYLVKKPQTISTISTSLFTKAERALLGDVDVVDTWTAYDILGIGKSTHGKPRGITTRKKE